MNTARKLETFTQDSQPKNKGFWKRINNIKVGVIPLLLYLLLALIVYGDDRLQRASSDMIGGFAIIMVMGMHG